MVAYNFRPEYEPRIQDGSKRSTIRPRGKRRHARIGESLQLYVGMRTDACRKIRDAVCAHRSEVTIRRLANGRLSLKVGGIALAGEQLERFVRRDGFDDCEAFLRFFERRYGLPFVGEYIEWR